MSDPSIVENLKSLEKPTVAILSITEAIRNIASFKIVDEGIIDSIYRDGYLNSQYSMFNCNMSQTKNNSEKKSHIINYTSLLLAGFIPIAYLTNSLILSPLMLTVCYVSSYKFRKTWIKDRLEVLAERKVFKEKIFHIAQGVKYLDVLCVNYNETEIKRSLYKILKTSEPILAHEVLRLQENLWNAFMNNESLGYLKEDAFDYHFVPDEFKENEMDPSQGSHLEFLTMDDDYDSIVDDANEAQSKFEDIFSTPSSKSFATDIEKSELKKVVYEASKDIAKKDEFEVVTPPLKDANDKSDEISKIQHHNEIEKALGLSDDNSPNLKEILNSQDEKLDVGSSELANKELADDKLGSEESINHESVVKESNADHIAEKNIKIADPLSDSVEHVKNDIINQGVKSNQSGDSPKDKVNIQSSENDEKEISLDEFSEVEDDFFGMLPPAEAVTFPQPDSPDSSNEINEADLEELLYAIEDSEKK